MFIFFFEPHKGNRQPISNNCHNILRKSQDTPKYSNSLYLSTCHQAQFITANVELCHQHVTHVDWDNDEKISFNTAVIITFLMGLFY